MSASKKSVKAVSVAAVASAKKAKKIGKGKAKPVVEIVASTGAVRQRPFAPRPGIVRMIETVLRKASKAKPVTKEGIVKALAKAFPERSVEAMRKTLSAEVPNGMGKRLGFTLATTKDGAYYISGGKRKASA